MHDHGFRRRSDGVDYVVVAVSTLHVVQSILDDRPYELPAWRVQPEQLQCAQHMLELKAEVWVVSCRPPLMPEAQRGEYRWLGHHHILIRDDLHFYDASLTLWHELRHAWQHEQSGDPLVCERDYHRATMQLGYWDNTYEQDAREYAMKQNRERILTEDTLDKYIMPVLSWNA